MGWWSRLGKALFPQEILRSAGIPSPESLVAGMVAYKIARMLPNEKQDASNLTLEIPLREERLLRVISCASRGDSNGTDVGGYVEIDLIAAKGNTQNIILSGQDTKMILLEVIRLGERSAQHQRYVRECQSQNTSLSVLEELF